MDVSNSILAFNTGGSAFAGSYIATFSCSDIYGHAGGDWVEPIADQYGANGNISLDPLFCNAAGGDFTLADDSPCRPHSPENPDCDRLGAWQVGCAASAVASWIPSRDAELLVFPNPTSGPCRVFLRGAGMDLVDVGVFDAAGRLVRSLYRGTSSPERIVNWDGNDESGRTLPSGMYWVRMVGPRSSTSVRLLNLR